MYPLERFKMILNTYRRLEDFDFDMIVINYGSIISPGNEQKNYWGSAAADQKASPNYMGVKNPVIDEIVDKLISAKSRKTCYIYKGFR